MVGGGQANKSNTQRRFAAFISYAHADAAIAAKLQSRLERYRLPKHLAHSHGGGNAALGQIFRDREDLAAAPSLSDAIRAAIAEADALVVICSPDAQASRWVGEEIALFRALHPDKAILAAVVRGAPAEAFPPALTEDGNEPLAADLRKEGDGEALGFLKIVAGIAGVPLDALVQRDAQRRIRRVMWITGSAIAAMLVMGVMTTLALQARNEAARQRAEAEGLVEYMLTDLRDKLKGVGRVEVMVPVNERVMEHYLRQGNLSDLPADSLERRARTLHAMGEDDDREGNLIAAKVKFQEAHRTTAALLDQSPQNPDRIFAHAQSEYWVGYAFWRQNDPQSVAPHWNAYLKQARALAKVEPNTVRSHMELGYAHGNLCDLGMKIKSDVNGAVQQCSNAIGFVQKALKLKPNDPKIGMDLANRLGWMADTLVDQNRFDEAISHRNEEKMIIEGLLESDPRNFELRHRQAWPFTGIGWAEYKRRNYRLAENHFVRSLAKLDALAVEFPDNRQLSISQVRTGIMLAMARRDGDNPAWREARRKVGVVATFARRSATADSLKRINEMLAKFDRETKA
jgi:tetratricopeptide (TPR) repeat protein